MSPDFKVLFTHGYFIEEDEKEQKIMKPYPPLGILYLSAWLEQNNIHNDVHDTTFSNFTKTENFIKSNDYDVIAIYTNLMTKLNVLKFVKFIKEHKPNCTVVLGGPDVTYNVFNYLNAGADVIVIGEGEQTMLEIVQACQQGVTKEFAHINGLAYKQDDGSIIKTDPRMRIKEINDIPYPNRKKIDMAAYLKVWKDNHGKSAMTMSTQRGCPYTCKWCSTAVYGQSYRRRSPQIVAEEMAAIKKEFNPDTIWFVDDVFTVSHKWLEAFAKEVNDRDARIPFECITRADRMNEDVIQWLKEAGCFRIWIGAESGSQKIIDLMDRRVEVGQVRKMIQETRKNGIETGTFIMLGYPGETQEDIIETVNHLKESNPDHFTITIAYPIKGTGLFAEVEDLQNKNLDWEKSTDRDRDFKREYSRNYYENAVSYVTNEVKWYQSKINQTSNGTSRYKYFIKSKVNRGIMELRRIFNT